MLRTMLFVLAMAALAAVNGASFKVSPRSEYSVGESAGGAIKQIYDPKTSRLFIMSPLNGQQAIKIARVDADGQVVSYNNGKSDIKMDAMPLAMALQSELGVLAVTDAKNNLHFYSVGGMSISSISVNPSSVGARSVAFSPAGDKVVVASTGAVRGGKLGAVSVVTVDLSVSVPFAAVSEKNVVTVDFSHFDSSPKPSGSQFPSSTPFSVEAAPNGVVIPDSTTAFVLLQDQNAYAQLDLTTAMFTALRDLGSVDRSSTGFDGANDNIANIATYDNLFSARNPASFVLQEFGASRLLITANSGMSTMSLEKVYNYTTIRALYDGADGLSPLNTAALTNIDTLLSSVPNLVVSNYVGAGGDGRIADFFSSGSRSFSIYDADSGALLYDSGSEFEEEIYLHYKDYFNAGSGEQLTMDETSPSKGIEPLSITTGVGVDGKSYVYVTSGGLGGIFVYEIVPTYSMVGGIQTVSGVNCNKIAYNNFRPAVDPTAVPDGTKFSMEDSIQHVAAASTTVGYPMLFSTSIASNTVNSYALLPDDCRWYQSRLSELKFAAYDDTKSPSKILEAPGLVSFSAGMASSFAMVTQQTVGASQKCDSASPCYIRVAWSILNQAGNTVYSGENSVYIMGLPSKITFSVKDTVLNACSQVASGKVYMDITHTASGAAEVVNLVPPMQIVWDWVQLN